MFFYISDRFFCEEVVTVILLLPIGILQELFLTIEPQIFRVIVMSLSLIGITVKKIETLFIGVPRIVETTQTPFANTGSLIASRFQQFSNGDFISRHIPALASYRIASRQQRGARWPTYRLSIEIREARPFSSQLIQARRFDQLIAVTTNIAIALIVGKYN